MRSKRYSSKTATFYFQSPEVPRRLEKRDLKTANNKEIRFLK